MTEVEGQPGNELVVEEGCDATTIIDVAAEPRSLRLLRLAAADAAASVGFDVERIDIARLVVDELASVLITAAGHSGRLRVHVIRGTDRIRLEASVRSRGEEELELGLIVRELLDVSIGADCWSVDQVGDRVEFLATVPARRRS